MVILLSRVFKYGFQNFIRNVLLSTATIAVMILTLSIVVSLFLFGAGARTAITSFQEKIDISVYFKAEADEAEILMVKKSLEELEEVKVVEYISRDVALERFKEKHVDDEAIIKSLDELGENPLFASLNIKAKETKSYAGIAAFLDSEISQDIIDKVNYSQNQIVIERLSRVVNTLKTSGWILAIILGIIAFLVAFNTIRLAIFSNRESIEIMRLVGSPNSLIRGPYIVEGLIHSLIATIITTIIFIPVVYILTNYLSVLVPTFILKSYFWSHFFGLFGLQILVSVAIGIVSSLIAMRKYLKI